MIPSGGIFASPALADPGGAAGTPPPPMGPNYFIFKCVFTETCRCRRFAPPTGNQGSPTALLPYCKCRYRYGHYVPVLLGTLTHSKLYVLKESSLSASTSRRIVIIPHQSVKHKFTLMRWHVDFLACQNTVYDIVFVLDSSTSVGQSNFDLLKNYVSQLVTRLRIGTNLNRVAIITYGATVDRAFYLNQFTNINQLVASVLNVRYLGGSSNLAEAFRVTRNDVLTSFVSRIIIIFATRLVSKQIKTVQW